MRKQTCPLPICLETLLSTCASKHDKKNSCRINFVKQLNQRFITNLEHQGIQQTFLLPLHRSLSIKKIQQNLLPDSQQVFNATQFALIGN